MRTLPWMVTRPVLAVALHGLGTGRRHCRRPRSVQHPTLWSNLNRAPLRWQSRDAGRRNRTSAANGSSRAVTRLPPPQSSLPASNGGSKFLISFPGRDNRKATAMMFHVLAFFCFAALASGQRRYYSLEDMPETNFDCRDKILGGYYADPEANCQMFHVCVKIPGQGVQDFRFLCPNETAFDQENQICADSGDIDCEAAGLYLENFDLYRIGSAPAKRPFFGSSKGTVVPLGPSTKSPVFTNNINEDDEFYLQRSDTGDRRLHSKDLLRGSSSSNFFNNRNKGKDLDDDDDEEPLPKPIASANPQYRPKPSALVRGKSQYNSQYRKVETTAQPQPTPQAENQNQLNDKKRTKIAVRKLARKRPEEEADAKPSPQPNYPSFTTQVTQKYSFVEPESRYNTVNRIQTSSSVAPTGSTVVRYQQNFRSKSDPPSTPAFFELTATPRTVPSKENGGLLRPIVAAGANYQANQNRQPNFQQARPTVAPVTGNQQTGQSFPQSSQNFQPNRQNFPQNRQQGRPNAPAGNNPPGKQLPAAAPPQAGNFQTLRTNQQTGSGQNFQPARTNPPSPPPPPPSPQGNYPAQRPSQPASNFRAVQGANGFQNQPKTNAPANQGARVGPSTNYPPADYAVSLGNRQTTASLPPNTRAQNINNGLLGRSTTALQDRTYFGRNGDEFDEGDNKEFLKTAPSNNFRPSDFNSFKSSYKVEALDKNNATKAAAAAATTTTTTKYYTPTIITTPKTPSTHSDVASTSRQTAFYAPSQGPTGQPSTQGGHYTQSATRKVPLQPTTTPKPASPARPFQPQANAAPPKPSEAKDTAYDYAYYDDGGSFSEYDSLDSIGDADFTRTSQRAKYRLI